MMERIVLRTAWRDVAAIERRGDVAVVRTISGKTAKANLRACANRDEVFAALDRRLAAYRGALERGAAEAASEPTPVAGQPSEGA
jgi:hypothetical protein